jgi:hypothetical protein
MQKYITPKMECTSPFTVEKGLGAVMLYHEEKHEQDSETRARRLRRAFRKATTDKMISSYLKKKGVSDWIRTGRKAQRTAKKFVIWKCEISKCPFSELRKLITETFCSVGCSVFIMTNRLPFVNCQMQIMKTLIACDRPLQHFSTIPKRSKFVFRDECAVYRSSSAGSVYFRSDDSQHYIKEMQHYLPRHGPCCTIRLPLRWFLPF